MDFEAKTFVLGIGAQKCGTSWLHSYFEGRGDIYMPHKEIHYFDSKYRPDLTRPKRKVRPVREGTPQALSRGAALKDGRIYRDYFQSRVPPEIDFFGEITPAYALIGEAGFREIRALFGRVRLIFIMRDPVERFYSHMRMSAARATKLGRPQKEAAALMENPARDERSRYETTIASLERVFGESEIIYLFYEKLFREDTLRTLCAFVGLPYAPADFGTVVNAGSAKDEESFDERVRARFESTYRFCREKFGAELPAEWHADSFASA